MRIVPPSNVPCTLPRLPSITTFTHGLPTLLRIRPTPAMPAHSPPSPPLSCRVRLVLARFLTPTASEQTKGGPGFRAPFVRIVSI